MLKIEAGKCYRDGHGRLRGPFRRTPNQRYPFTDGNYDYSREGEMFIGVTSRDNLTHEDAITNDTD